ncbi:MAG: hypothetical protein A3B90_03065 [Candidatus Magasanikbacteria bacterium RIFCSPHIGHO2_02_FULL_41_13]|uniref:Uncharacterized protein n=1 Tax=Candidatus Magasanikbacteria bacterium RIFCSPHIGHO2_02_FULL_41_13 TaxID=1798676 RepID=A0A1F6M776_9BACT|nr:MAG: hypothetical protein A3B90_03065 [Candidatus Magasanikbacteria bacterium RIFCSPHIGHO2_02_FULL_41_13]
MFRAELLLADVLNVWLGMDSWDVNWLLQWFSGENIGNEESSIFLKALATRRMRSSRGQFINRLRVVIDFLRESPAANLSPKVIFHILTLAKGLQSPCLGPALVRLREAGKTQGVWGKQDLFLFYDEALRACVRPFPMVSAAGLRSSSRRSRA